ncbi:MAG TPA: sigma-70 family RNA polymerase sigma factor [Solirubrobacteraceae bacterium]
MEASALQAPPVLAPTRACIGVSFLRLRSDEQLVAMFRAGHEDAFRAIHDRYKGRLFAYARQMLPGRQDAEDALQDVFLRAYAGLRTSDRELALRAWLYRVAHNRCIDELRRPVVSAHERMEFRPTVDDPVAQADQRESLRRLVGDIRRLPEQQRSALLMRELGGMTYADVGEALGVSVAAVKSLLVRARLALVQAIEARDTACSEIRTELMLAHDRRMRPDAKARRHMRDCAGCREFRRDLRGVSRQLAALAPALGPIGVITKLLGFGGGAGSSAAAGGGAVAAGGAVGGTGAAASAGALGTGVGHVATLLAATVVAAGGAVEIQHAIGRTSHVKHHLSIRALPSTSADPVAFVPSAPPQAAVESSLPAPGTDASSTAATRTASPASAPASGTSTGSAPSQTSPVRTTGIGVNDQLASSGPPTPTVGPTPTVTGMGNPPSGLPGGSSGNGGLQPGGGTKPGTGGTQSGGGGCVGGATTCVPGVPGVPQPGSPGGGTPAGGTTGTGTGTHGGTSGPGSSPPPQTGP